MKKASRIRDVKAPALNTASSKGLYSGGGTCSLLSRAQKLPNIVNYLSELITSSCIRRVSNSAERKKGRAVLLVITDIGRRKAISAAVTGQAQLGATKHEHTTPPNDSTHLQASLLIPRDAKPSALCPEPCNLKP